jgi:thiol-disulfide isomerase/thioredoxin
VVAAVAAAVVLAGCGSTGRGAVTTAAEQTDRAGQTDKPVATIDDRPDGPAVACTGLDRALAAASTALPGSALASTRTARSGDVVVAASTAKPGKALPKLTLPCLGGGPDVNLAQLRGPAVLNVWASWCGPCGDEVPYLVAVEKLLHSKVRFIGVDLTDEPADARVWNDYHQVGWPSLRDPHGAIRGPLHVPGPPVTFFLAPDGTVAGVHYGAFTSADELRRAVETKLGVGTTAPAKGLG